MRRGQHSTRFLVRTAAPGSLAGLRSLAVRFAAPLLLMACSREGEPRAQLVIVVDTDAPLQGQLAGRPELSADAAVDTLRVDAVDSTGVVYDVRELVVPSPDDWPVSFGVATTEVHDKRVRLRLRLFRGELAVPELSQGVLEPLGQVAIDRVFDAALPEDGMVTHALILSLACVGRAPSFLEPASTCIDAARLSAATPDGATNTDDDGALAPTRAGTSPVAAAMPCTAAAPLGAVCIAGGYSVLGDPDLVGIDDLLVDESVPLRPVVLSPFWMDGTEVTVGRFRAWVQAGLVTEALPAEYDPMDVNQQYCTWRGVGDPSGDAMPLNCVGTATASQACALAAGRLPTEAQWEHAARGRGQHRAYPWGSTAPECCALSAARYSGPCFGDGPEPAGAHAPVPTCSAADVSRDGVLDLGGSLVEMVLDRAASYDSPCWSWQGYSVDPACQDGGTPGARGGSWNISFVQALSALRKRSLPSEAQGFRCVYRDGSP